MNEKYADEAWVINKVQEFVVPNWMKMIEMERKMFGLKKAQR
jgi:hypothetical protein